MNCRTALVRRLVILGILSVVLLAGCGGGTAPSANNPPPDPPGAIVGHRLSTNGVGAGGTQYSIHGDGSERSDKKGSHVGSRAYPRQQLHGNRMRND